MTPQYYVEPAQLKRLQNVLGGCAKGLKKQLAIACRAAANTARREIVAAVKTELQIAGHHIKGKTSIVTKPTPQSIQAVVRLSKTGRIPLRWFNVREPKKGGISYKISRHEGGKRIPHAWRHAGFAGGNIFQRKLSAPKELVTRGRNAGRMKQPLEKLHGPSPYGVFVRHDMQLPVSQTTAAELKLQIEKRIRYLLLKQAGIVK